MQMPVINCYEVASPLPRKGGAGPLMAPTTRGMPSVARSTSRSGATITRPSGSTGRSSSRRSSTRRLPKQYARAKRSPPLATQRSAPLKAEILACPGHWAIQDSNRGGKARGKGHNSATGAAYPNEPSESRDDPGETEAQHGPFDEVLLMLERLPLTDGERAEAVRRLLAGTGNS